MVSFFKHVFLMAREFNIQCKVKIGESKRSMSMCLKALFGKKKAYFMCYNLDLN